MNRVKVSIVIPAFGRHERLRKAVESAIRQDLDPALFEVIVVDSSPADDVNEATVRELATRAACRLVCLRKEPEGPGPSRNLGVSHARGEFIAFLDSDCEAAPDWLRTGLAAFAPGIGIVQGRTIPDPSVPRGTLSDFVWIENETFIYETANIFYRREAFDQAGGFPAQADLHGTRDQAIGGEDVDLAWRVKRAGWESRFEPKALVVHEVVSISPAQWLFNKRLFIYPHIVRSHPYLRQFFFAGYFYDRIHASFALALAGIALAPLHPASLLLSIPWIFLRASEKTRLRGPFRLLRAAIYFPKDLASFLILAAGSLRFRRVLL